MVLCAFFLFLTRSWFKKFKMQTYDHSPVLFVGDDGAPMEFYIRSCQKRSVIKALVEHGGGSVRYMEGRNIIRLVEPGCRVLKVPNGGLTVSVQFIWDCVEQNRLLDINKYAIKVVSLNTSDISDNDEETNFVKKRPLSPPYRQEEDITLLKIILSNKDNFKEGFIDTSYWDNVAKYKILDRTTNSIRNRANFLSQLTSREAVKFGLSEEDQKILRKLRDTNRQKCVLQEDYIIIEHVRKRIDRMRDINFYNTLKENKCIASTSRALRSRFLDHIVPNIELYDISQNLKMEIRKAANNPTSYQKASKESHSEHLDDLNKLATKNSPIAGTAQISHTKNGLKRKHFTKNASKNNSVADGRGHSASNHKKEDSIFNHASYGLGKKSSKSSVLHDNKETHKNTLESYYKSKDKVQCFDHNGDVDRHFLRECVYKKSFNKCDEHISLPSKSPVNCNFKTPAVVENAKDTPVPHSINNHFLQHFNHMDSVDREARYNNIPMKISNIHTTAEEILDTFDVNILEKCQNTRKSKRQDFQANDPALRLSSVISDVAEEHSEHVVLPSDSANCIPQSFKRTSVSVLPTDHYSSSSESENDVENPAQKENTLHLYEATSVLKNIENIISFCPWLEDVSLSALDVSNRFNKLKGAVYKSVLASQAEKILKKGALNTDDKTLLLKYLVCESEIPPQDASILISSYIDTKIRRKGLNKYGDKIHP